MKRIARSHSHVVLVALSLVSLLLPPAAMSAQSSGRTTFSGRAAALRVEVLGQQAITVADTGNQPPSGGTFGGSLLEVNNVLGIASAQVLHATTIGQGDRSRSDASVANLNLTVGGNTITAGFLMSRAMARCAPPEAAAVSGSSEIASLVINGQEIVSLGLPPNTTVTLPNGKVVINEQSSTVNNRYGAITVNALHVIVNNLDGSPLADVVVASAYADINCAGQACTGGDFVTGGGWIIGPSGARANFAVAGGIKNGALWGHLMYIEHRNPPFKVKGTGVTAYIVTGNTSRRIEGTAEIQNAAGTYQAEVDDRGEPGRNDTFAIMLSGGYSASGPLVGGNIQLHKPCQ